VAGESTTARAEASETGPPVADNADFQFRVFRRGSERRAFRLERVFWQLLDEAASAKSQKLRDFVFAIIDSEPDAKNHSSSLRTAVARWLSERLIALSEKAPSDSGIVLFRACPSPGMIIGEDRRIVAFNIAMQSFIAGRRPHGQKSDMVDARFAFELPIGQIIRFFVDAPDKIMECDFKITLSGELISGRCRVCLYRDGKIGARQLGVFIVTGMA
jgi:predicted DNA-binding ribbon-helix-helix protein